MNAPVLLAAGPSPLWYATRAGGTVALLLLTATVALGIATGGGWVPRRGARFEPALLHRNLSLLTLVFLTLHVVTALSDTFVHIGWAATVLPFASPYRTVWLGLGTVALDLLLAVAITSAVRLRLGVRLWKAVHWSAYAAWPVALVHAAGTGTDSRSPLQLALYALCAAVTVSAVVVRLRHPGRGPRPVRRVAGYATVALGALLVALVSGTPPFGRAVHGAARPAPRTSALSRSGGGPS